VSISGEVAHATVERSLHHHLGAVGVAPEVPAGCMCTPRAGQHGHGLFGAVLSDDLQVATALLALGGPSLSTCDFDALEVTGQSATAPRPLLSLPRTWGLGRGIVVCLVGVHGGFDFRKHSRVKELDLVGR